MSALLALGAIIPFLFLILGALSVDYGQHGWVVSTDYTEPAIPTWVLIVVTESDMTAPCVSLHGSADAALTHFRSGWDPDGDYANVHDEDALLEIMRDIGVYASIEIGYRP